MVYTIYRKGYEIIKVRQWIISLRKLRNQTANQWIVWAKKERIKRIRFKYRQKLNLTTWIVNKISKINRNWKLKPVSKKCKTDKIFKLKGSESKWAWELVRIN